MRYGFYLGWMRMVLVDPDAHWWAYEFDVQKHGTLLWEVSEALDEATYCCRYEPPSRTEL